MTIMQPVTGAPLHAVISKKRGLPNIPDMASKYALMGVCFLHHSHNDHPIVIIS